MKRGFLEDSGNGLTVDINSSWGFLALVTEGILTDKVTVYFLINFFLNIVEGNTFYFLQISF